MSASMLSPTNPAYRPDAPKGGILLNAIRPSPQSVPKSPSTTTSYTTPSSPSSSDSASGSDDQAPKTQQKRKITFAPLPNPRAQDDVPVIVFDHTSDKLYENPEAATSSSGDDNPAVILPDPTTRSPQLSAKKASNWGHSTKKFLKPFYKPLQKSDNSEGGALGLFRSSSRDSTASSVGTLTDSGAPLGRRMSTGSSPFDIGRTGPDRSGLALHPVTSENGGVATGTRMLNGRVYGGRRTAIQRKEVEKEPEFVEWGYGGMGSNRGSSASSTYARVQSSHTNVVSAEDEDDGSGMGWVRKRREAREREKREREEREAKEREAAPAAPATEPTPTAAAADAQDATPTHDDSSAAAHPDSVSPPPDAPEHITQAVRIPSGHHHHFKPSPARRSSDLGSGRSTPIIKPNNDSTPTVTSVPHSTVPSVGSSLRMSATAEQAQSSEDSESDEESTEREDEPREEDDDEEDEEESEDDANVRKTSVCAGVEKISRHKE
ncbi:hypothetical protein FRC00_006128 [Tulasnella sp. 408]|nr:hypothetical protein FRC00_006128 [Tulasnella sp. 408]